MFYRGCRTCKSFTSITLRRKRVTVSAIVAFLCGMGQIHTNAQSVNLPRVTREAIDRLDLYDGEVVTLNSMSGSVAGGGFTVIFPFEAKQYTLELLPHSLRAANYELVVQLADSSYQNIEPGPERTMRGTVREIEGSAAAASWLDDGLHAMILLPDRRKIWIEPIANHVAGATANQHIVYHGDDVRPTGLSCMLIHPPRGGAARLLKTQGDTTATGTVAGSFVRIAELAIDADVEYFIEEGSSFTKVEEKVTSIINTVNLQYERDVLIRHIITRIIVRTAEPDPYSSSDPNTLLGQFKLQWENFHSDIPRDVAQLFTGKNMSFGVIGVAWLGVFPFRETLCGSWGYSVVEPNCGFGCFNFSTKTDLSAHELGHNWGADHCDCPNWTMNPTIQGANRFEPNDTIPDIVFYRDTRRCLDEGDELRRIIMTADTVEVEEGGSLQLTVTADFQFGADQDVTSEVAYTVDPPEAGSVDVAGVFTAHVVNSTICTTITASFTFDGITRSSVLVITVMDLDNPMLITIGDPPDGVIDARLPSDLNGGNPTGWQIFDITLNGEVCNVTTTGFAVSVEGGFSTPPIVESLQEIDLHTVRLFLSSPIEPGAWTTITHVNSGTSIRVGFLPGDVNGDAVSNTDDVLALMEIIRGALSPGPLWSRDIDRSGRSFPPDLIMLINVLNGADALDPWLGVSLP